jgi:NAD-dependent SIR2 family protein deacetylase
MATFSLLLFWAVFLFFPQSIWAYTTEECLGCHGTGNPKTSKQLSGSEFLKSVHGQNVSCQECHLGIRDQDHQQIKGSGRVDCRACHEQENRHGLSALRKGSLLPTCQTCHTRHGILKKENPASTVNPENLTETCRGCHPRECGERDYWTYLPSLQVASHAKQDFSRLYRKSNCLGCHQGQAAHGEEQPLNSQTCSKCHGDLGKKASFLGTIHPPADLKTHPAFLASMVMDQALLILLGLGGIVFLLARFRKSRRKG